jgi:hypothetical protein
LPLSLELKVISKPGCVSISAMMASGASVKTVAFNVPTCVIDTSNPHAAEKNGDTNVWSTSILKNVGVVASRVVASASTAAATHKHRA